MLNRERGACDVEAEMEAVPAATTGAGVNWNGGFALRAGDGVGSPAGVDSRAALAAPRQRFIRHCILVGYLAAATYLRVWVVWSWGGGQATRLAGGLVMRC